MPTGTQVCMHPQTNMHSPICSHSVTHSCCNGKELEQIPIMHFPIHASIHPSVRPSLHSSCTSSPPLIFPVSVATSLLCLQLGLRSPPSLSISIFSQLQDFFFKAKSLARPCKELLVISKPEKKHQGYKVPWLHL